MFNGNRVLLILDNTIILSMLLFEIELICSRAWCFFGLKSKALHSGTKDALLFCLSLVHFGM